MTPTLFSQVPFDSPEAWSEFTLMHSMAHQTTAARLAVKGKLPELYPISDFPRTDNGEYLLAHYRVHQSIAQLLALPAIGDISEADFSDRSSFENWMGLHATIHEAENSALGIFV